MNTIVPATVHPLMGISAIRKTQGSTIEATQVLLSMTVISSNRCQKVPVMIAKASNDEVDDEHFDRRGKLQSQFRHGRVLFHEPGDVVCRIVPRDCYEREGFVRLGG